MFLITPSSCPASTCNVNFNANSSLRGLGASFSGFSDAELDALVKKLPALPWKWQDQTAHYYNPGLFLESALRFGLPAPNGLYVGDSSVCLIDRINDLVETLPRMHPAADIAAAQLIEQAFLPDWSDILDKTAKKVNESVMETLEELQAQLSQQLAQNHIQTALQEHWNSLSNASTVKP